MNKATKAGLGLLAFLIVLGFAGRTDYDEEVLTNMPQDAYEAIVLKLGDGASGHQIVKEYNSDREYYDSLSNY